MAAEGDKQPDAHQHTLRISSRFCRQAAPLGLSAEFYFGFNRLKRSSSQDFEGGRERLEGGEFRRGGVRATATARLAGWTQRSRLYVFDNHQNKSFDNYHKAS